MGLFDFIKKKKKAGEEPTADAPASAHADAKSAPGKKDEPSAVTPAASTASKSTAGKSKGKADLNVPDPRKAKKFFEYAQTVSDARNYDYAIVCWVNGMKHDPENMAAHEKLRDVSLRRMVAGGKAAGGREKKNLPGGKSAAEKMLGAEFLWAHDPLNASLAMQVMDLADKAEMDEVAYWVGKFVLEANAASPKPNKQVYAKVKALYMKMKAWDLAADAQEKITQMEPGNMAEMQALKQLQAEATVMKGGYGQEGTSFRKAIKDADKQKALEAADAIAATDSQIDQNIKRTRREYEENPENPDTLAKLVRALLARGDEAGENEAITYLNAAYAKSGVYRIKMQVGDIRMKNYARRLKDLRKAAEEAHVEVTKKKISDQYQALRLEQLHFELAEYEERCKNYPTQMDLRFQLGLRQFILNDMEKAISSLQEAQADPKNRAQALRYLGEAFHRKSWFEEAIDTFRRGIEAHPMTDDRLGMEMRYFLMRSLEAKAVRDKSLPVAEEAAKVCSQIAQTDFNYKDIRLHMENLRKLVEELRK